MNSKLRIKWPKCIRDIKDSVDFKIISYKLTALKLYLKFVSVVYKNNRGYGGSCLPKDISSISKQAKENGLNPKLLDAVISKNKDYKVE